MRKISLKSEFNWLNCLILLLAGAATTFCFAPFFWFFVPLITLPIFAHLMRSLPQNCARLHDLAYGFCFGLGYFLASTYWIANALLVDSATYGWYIPFATLGLSAILSGYFALMGLLLRRARSKPIVAYSFYFASAWLGCELLRSFLFSGFPWNLLGYAWGASNFSIQAASLFGVWGLSAITALLALTPLWLLARKFLAVVIACLCVIILLIYGEIRLQKNLTTYVDNVQLRIVQAAIPQELKWNAAHKIAAFREHVNLSKQDATVSPTHIIWPESAMTTPFNEGDFPAKLLADVASPFGSLITGVVRVQQRQIFNSLQAITNAGKIDAIYDKRALVPFGEYMPFRAIIPFKKLTQGTVDFVAGIKDDVQKTKGAPPFRAIICYEAIFPLLAQSSGAKWLLNITNDAWFGDSTGPRQHLQMARMRAVEQGLPLIRAAGSGVSAAIDPYGRILQSLGIGEKGVIDVGLPNPAASQPFAAQNSLIIALIFLLFFWIIGNMNDYMKKNAKKIAPYSLLLFVAACGEGTVRENLGLVRNPPDEFKVVSRAPLTVPREFFLYPPEEALEHSVGSEPNNSAHDAIFGETPQDNYLLHYQENSAPTAQVETMVEKVGSTNLPSAGESGLLQKTKAAQPTEDIRAILRKENSLAEQKDENLLEKLKTPIKKSEPIIDAPKELERIKSNKESGAAVNKGEVPTITENTNIFDGLF